MPYDDPDLNDPQELVGHLVPGCPESIRDMAYVFAEEFARLGFGRARILHIFRNPHYAGAYGAYRELGREAVERIIDECLAVWGRTELTRSSVPGSECATGRSTEGQDPSERS